MFYWYNGTIKWFWYTSTIRRFCVLVRKLMSQILEDYGFSVCPLSAAIKIIREPVCQDCSPRLLKSSVMFLLPDRT